MSDARVGRDMAVLSNAECLARAVLLFHRSGPWTDWDREVWRALTGTDDATTRTLCMLARMIEHEEELARPRPGRWERPRQ
jgi:hypothetical protein